MALSVIVSYDGTDNDRDALSLGRLLADAGAEVALAYVRHAREEDPGSESAAQAEAEALLAEGAAELGGEVKRHVIMNPATPAGLGQLAEREGADVLVFGSDYRTATGHVQPGTSASHLMQGGPVAIAVAPAGMRDERSVVPESVGEVSEPGDWSARETAESLAAVLGAEMAPKADFAVDFLVVGSQSTAVPGRVAISAAAQYIVETARCPVLVVPRGGRVQFTNSGR